MLGDRFVMNHTAEVLRGLQKPNESDRAFARRCGLKWVTTLQGILHGSEPKERTLAVIAEHLGISINQLRYGLSEREEKTDHA